MMMHTQGPWQCYADLPSTEPNWHIVTNESRMRVLANVHIEPGNATDAANARLIAAAPDMLNVLKAACAILDGNREDDEFNSDLASDLWKNDIHEQMTAVIAKVEGVS